MAIGRNSIKAGGLLVLAGLSVGARASGAGIDVPPIGNLHRIDNQTGVAMTYADNVPTDGELNIQAAFFQSFGTNDRSCFACHAPRGGWSITPGLAQFLFDATAGTDPMFRAVDGAVSPTADVSTLAAKRLAFAPLLSKGLIRVGMALPRDAEFTLAAVDDPYHFASAAQLSLFRRPLPSSNLKFLSDVMWDGRQTGPGGDLDLDLANQANDATRTHAQAAQDLSAAERAAVVAFETSIYVAQIADAAAGALTDAGGRGGPQALAVQPYYAGINDRFGKDPTGKAFDPVVFTLYGSWLGLPATDAAAAARGAVARGEALFNTRAFSVAGVSGLNDVLGLPVVAATCSSCHNTPNVGSNSAGMKVDLGIANAARRTADLPLYTLRNVATGEERQVSDPGRALVTGQWRDIGRFKVPTLRGLAARAPYFHDGSAPTLPAVVSYLDKRFQIGLTPAEAADLAAFLGAL